MELDAPLAASNATAAFAADVRAYADFRAAPRVVVLRAAPRIKVLRVITQLVTLHPGLAVDGVRIDAISGCADYRGVVTALTGDGAHAFAFAWDCNWRAAAEGWVDQHGTPDQARAAREFGWRCFKSWSHQAPLRGEDDGKLVSTQPGA